MMQRMGAVLVAEIGSAITRVTLVDNVDGEARLIGQAAVPGSIDPPHENALVAIIEAASQIGEMVSRKLVDGNNLIMPQTSEGDGINSVVAVTSASGVLGVVIAAIAIDVSARSAIRASRATYTSMLQVISLDQVATNENRDSTWIERQIQMLTGLEPDVVLIAGGLEDGAQDALVRLAHIVGLTALTTHVDAQGQQRQDVSRRPVVFAGNSHARERVIESLSGRADLRVVDNVRPTLDVERLDPARYELIKLYNDLVLPKLPGLAALRRLNSAPLRTSADAAGLMTRYIAERYTRSTLVVDAGSSHTTGFLHSQGMYSPAVLGGVGTGYGIGGVLAQRGLAAIGRWLPFPIAERELTHWLLNKMLRPHIAPVSREDLLIEHAIAREALSLVMAVLHDERQNAPYDLVVAGGGVVANAPHPGLSALTILDALQPTAAETVLAVELHLDSLGLMSACGALAFAAPEAAITLFERDLLGNTPLATCVIVLGEGRPGETAVEAVLNVVGETPQQITVQHGQIGRLALAPGRKGQLILRPAGSARIGQNAAGAEVASDIAAINGSALGVVIDARGRPLRLPDDPYLRQQALWEWMVALGAEQGPLPYEAATTNEFSAQIAIPAVSAPPPPPPEPAKRAELPPALEIASVDNDLAKLRQTVEEPKKKGFFRRR